MDTNIIVKLQRNWRSNRKRKHDVVYGMLGDCVWVFQGMKICEGFITQDIIFNIINESNKYDNVYQEKKIPLNPDNIDKRKNHKVDVLCINHSEKVVDAFNSKGASFNNTQSQENDLNEYNKYLKAINDVYPEYKVTYNILKDNYNENEKKYKAKCDYLSKHGIKHYSTQKYLDENYGFKNFEEIRRRLVFKKLKERINERSIDLSIFY